MSSHRARSVLCFLPMLASALAQEPRQFLRQRVKMTEAEIREVEAGRAVAREVQSPDSSEVFLFGAVFIKANPLDFVKRYVEIEKLVDGKGYLGAGRFSSPPRIEDLGSLRLPREEIEALRECFPGDCELQLPVAAMEAFRGKVPWGGREQDARANHLLRELALGALAAYQRGGNRALGVYRDKDHPVEVARVFQTVLSRARNLPNQLPAFSKYLLDYPGGKPANTWDFFYWENIKFGLKPTFRMNHAIVHQPPASPVKWLVASKQIYSTHYFQTALDLWFCVQTPGIGGSGYYLVTFKGSRQAGLTGFKGSIVRRVAVSRSMDAMRGALERMKSRLEAGG